MTLSFLKQVEEVCEMLLLDHVGASESRMLLARLVCSESVLYKSSWYVYTKQPFDVDDGLIFDAWSDPNDCVHSTMNETPDDTTEAV